MVMGTLIVPNVRIGAVNIRQQSKEVFNNPKTHRYIKRKNSEGVSSCRNVVSDISRAAGKMRNFTRIATCKENMSNDKDKTAIAHSVRNDSVNLRRQHKEVFNTPQTPRDIKR